MEISFIDAKETISETKEQNTELIKKEEVLRAIITGDEAGTDIVHLYNVIEKMQAAENRPKAVWVGIDEEPHEEWECSNCGNIVNTYMQDELEEHKYCHKCGAKMSMPWTDMRG